MGLLTDLVWYLHGKKHWTRSGYNLHAQHHQADGLNADLSALSFMVTGANSGLGYVTALFLATHGAAHVHMVCRNAERGAAAAEEIRAAANEAKSSTRVALHIGDIGRPGDIIDIAKGFKERGDHLHVLVNNAGALINHAGTTPEGYELAFAVNTLGTYLLTVAMLPVLTESCQSLGRPARVITVTSGSQYRVRLRRADMNKYLSNGIDTYSATKRQQTVMMQYLADTYKPEEGGDAVDAKQLKPLFFSVHPGWADTPGVQRDIAKFYQSNKDQFRTPDEGADGMLWLAVTQDPCLHSAANGSLWLDRQVVPVHLTLAGTSHSSSQVTACMEYLDQEIKPWLQRL